jgi:putative endonuclease
MNSGRITQTIIRALDVLTAVVGKKPDRAAHLETGTRGEEDAYFYLRRQGYTIVARNYRSPRRNGELDLVGWDGDILCFIEVKTRTTRDVKPAEAAVDQEKQRDLIAVAREYLRRLPKQASHRFDVVSVYYDKAEPEIALIKDAFSEAAAFARR